MDDFNWDIPPSTIKNGREWSKKIHGGYWCICYDVQYLGEAVRMVLQASSDPGRLRFSVPLVYLVGPDGERADN
jgi:hypothetical protein